MRAKLCSVDGLTCWVEIEERAHLIRRAILPPLPAFGQKQRTYIDRVYEYSCDYADEEGSYLFYREMLDERLL